MRKYCSLLLTNASFFMKTLHIHRQEKASFEWVMMRSLDSGFGGTRGFHDCGKMRADGEEMGRRLSISGLKYNSQS